MPCAESQSCVVPNSRMFIYMNDETCGVKSSLCGSFVSFSFVISLSLFLFPALPTPTPTAVYAELVTGFLHPPTPSSLPSTQFPNHCLFPLIRSSSDTHMLKLQRFNRKTHGFRTFSHFGPTSGTISPKTSGTLLLSLPSKANSRYLSSFRIFQLSNIVHHPY